MKVLMINKFLYPNGGSETYMFELGKQLERMGHEVQYFGMEHEGRCVGNRVDAYTGSMDFHGGSKLTKLTYPLKTIYSSEARQKLRLVLDDFRPDVIHLNNFNYQLTPSIILEADKWRKESGHACLYIIGDGDAEYVDSVKAAIGEKGLESCVFWQKKAPQYQMKGVYQQADLFLLPTEYEIFGMVLLEAMFFRRVVLTTPNGGADMLLRSGENGLVLEKSDPARWAKTLLDIAADPEKKARMEQAAYETVIHENTWDALADRFLKVYEKR